MVRAWALTDKIPQYKAPDYAFRNPNIHSVQSETLPDANMAAVKALVGKVMGLSDLTHATLAVGASSALIPLLPSLSPSHLAALHLSSLATGVGTQMYVSFVAGPTMFLHLPRHVFGDVQARLFPKMGMVTTGTSLLTLATYAQVHPTDTATYLLAASLGLNALNSFYVFSKCSDLMYDLRQQKEGTDERKRAGMKFGIAHAISVGINFVSLSLGLYFTTILGSKIAGVW